MHRSMQSSALVFSFAFSLVPAFALAQAPQTPPPDASAPPVTTAVPVPVPLPELPQAQPPITQPPPPTNPPMVQQPAVVMPPPVVPPPAVAQPVVAPHNEKFPTRSWRLGPSIQTFLYDPFPYQRVSRVGTGLFGVYEFYLKPSFAIGINLSYRLFPGETRLHQVGYGLMLKHYLAGMNSPDSVFMPFVEYGLLLQINKLSNRQGTGTAHDTRLSVGTDFRIAKKIFFVEASYHYSRLGLFEQPGEPLHNLEFDIGYRHPW